MNFFEIQDRSRRNTGMLLFLFLIVSAVMIFSVYAIIVGVVMLFHYHAAGQMITFWQPDFFLPLAGGLGALLFLSAILYFLVLWIRGGGVAVAESFDGREILPDTGDPQERQLLNIVDEVTIAARIPAPKVFVFPDASLNAFAAGSTRSNAVVAVSAGALNAFTREEMQGVVAHEFSHILNGDMRTNMHLMGLLFGFRLIMLCTVGMSIAIAAMGYLFGEASSSSSRRSSRSNDESAGLFLGLMGLVAFVGGFVFVVSFWILGKLAQFFGRILQAAISRQREFLADATAVQFTRNPLGLANALKKIGRFTNAPSFSKRKAAATSHMFFVSASLGFWSNLFSTHPPLIKRIKALDPSFDGTF